MLEKNEGVEDGFAYSSGEGNCISVDYSKDEARHGVPEQLDCGDRRTGARTTLEALEDHLMPTAAPTLTAALTAQGKKIDTFASQVRVDTQKLVHDIAVVLASKPGRFLALSA